MRIATMARFGGTAPPRRGHQAANLGPAPFTYHVELTLDERTYEVLLTLDDKQYVGTAVWPRDEKKHEAPNTMLTFDPTLPIYTAE